MKKIKLEIYDKIVNDSTLSRIDIKLLFWLFERQDEKGNVIGVYYKQIEDDLHISIPSFYNSIKRLEQRKKPYIRTKKSDNSDIDFYIIGNDFTSGYKGYVDINVIRFFNNPKVFKLKSGAFRFAMHLIKRLAANTNEKRKKHKGETDLCLNENVLPEPLIYLRKTFIEKISENIKTEDVKQHRVLKNYTKDLKEFFNIKLNGQYIEIETKDRFFIKNTEKRFSSKTAYEYMTIMLCRRNNIKTDETNLNDTSVVINQYHKKCKEKKFSVESLFKSALLNSTKENKKLIAKNINHLMDIFIKKKSENPYAKAIEEYFADKQRRMRNSLSADH